MLKDPANKGQNQSLNLPTPFSLCSSWVEQLYIPALAVDMVEATMKRFLEELPKFASMSKRYSQSTKIC